MLRIYRRTRAYYIGLTAEALRPYVSQCYMEVLKVLSLIRCVYLRLLTRPCCTSQCGPNGRPDKPPPLAAVRVAGNIQTNRRIDNIEAK